MIDGHKTPQENAAFVIFVPLCVSYFCALPLSSGLMS